MDKFRHLFQQIIRFGIVGGLAFVVDFGVLTALVELGHMNELVAAAIAFCVSVIFNYILSVVWVFDVDKEKSAARNFSLFIILSIVGLGLTELIMWIMIDKMGIFYLLSKIVATAVVMVYNFITRKIFLE